MDKYKIKFKGDIEEIYEFLCNLIEEQKYFFMENVDNKIVINLILPVASLDETITLEINNKWAEFRCFIK